MKTYVRSMKIPFHTIRLVVGRGLRTEIMDYYPTREEAERAAERMFKNYNVEISQELLNVQVKAI